MANPLYPDVPITLGVPRVLRAVGNLIPGFTSTITALTRDATDILRRKRVYWGVFTLDGKVALDATSVQALETNKEYALSDYPIEEGSFETYNKVERPRETRLILTKTGNLGERTIWYDKLQELLASLDLFVISTPEANYVNVNFTREYMQRTSSANVSMLSVEVGFRQVRNAVAEKFSDSGAQGGGTTGNGVGGPQTKTPVAVGSVQAVAIAG